LKHSDIKIIWKDYPAELHDWLLGLTEVFDLTFPLENEPVNLVPCLLPEKQPKVGITSLKQASMYIALIQFSLVC